MTLAARVLKIAGVGVVIVVALVAILTALRTELPRSPGVMSDALGPDAGERVDDYLARAAGSLDQNKKNDDDDDEDPTTGGAAPRWALVTAGAAWSVTEAADIVRALPRVSGLYVQVPVDGVAMPVTGVTLAEPVAGETGRAETFGRGLEQVVARLDTGGPNAPAPAAPAAASGALPPGGDRAAATAALTVSRLRAGEPAIIGVLARGTTEQLRAVAEQPRVRAVEALPADAVWERFAVRPLQPQQVDAAVPLPDEARIPAR
ncbi:MULTISPECIES: hypothetical protein [Dietzia]|uniref:hypothetical protein n=1 Tax=Dietzia TaxID=37914 RepID=UPI0021195D39|nr:hypothetical protein [Dietzia sp. Die43]